ncbi:MAG: endonuclease Q family protein, partial [Candidatus Aenigmarchaeota archaeon]|nr:endonuclease Q family protein [Candidatus Aenigmarchaeota archaeon]
HRQCKVVLHPKESKKLKNICPVCKKPLTIGVLQRVEELADREEGFVPKKSIPFKTLLPLYEIIMFVYGSINRNSKKILEIHDSLIKSFGSELEVLLRVPREDLLNFADEKIANAIINVREQKIKYNPGADGEYGKPIFDDKNFRVLNVTKQKSLEDF